jgi:hypothetical protein
MQPLHAAGMEALFRNGAAFGAGHLFGYAAIPAAITDAEMTRLTEYLAYHLGISL